MARCGPRAARAARRRRRAVVIVFLIVLGLVAGEPSSRAGPIRRARRPTGPPRSASARHARGVAQAAAPSPPRSRCGRPGGADLRLRRGRERARPATRGRSRSRDVGGPPPQRSTSASARRGSTVNGRRVPASTARVRPRSPSSSARRRRRSALPPGDRALHVVSARAGIVVTGTEVLDRPGARPQRPLARRSAARARRGARPRDDLRRPPGGHARPSSAFMAGAGRRPRDHERWPRPDRRRPDGGGRGRLRGPGHGASTTALGSGSPTSCGRSRRAGGTSTRRR